MFLIERYEQSHLFNTLQIQEKREASVFVIMRRSYYVMQFYGASSYGLITQMDSVKRFGII